MGGAGRARHAEDYRETECGNIPFLSRVSVFVLRRGRAPFFFVRGEARRGCEWPIDGVADSCAATVIRDAVLFQIWSFLIVMLR